jgi:hypothetical protein
LAQQAPDADADVRFIEDIYAKQKEDARKPLDELNLKYRAAIEKCRADAQNAGQLEGVLEAQRALDELAKDALPDGKATDPNLEKVETVYLKQLEVVKKAMEEPLNKAARDRSAFLDDLAIRLTKAGKIEDAVKVRASAEKAKDQLAAADVAKEIVKVPEGTVKIISARYGTGGTYADVTAKVKEMMETKRESFWASPELFGGDPVPYYNKSVQVRYTKDGIARDRWWGREVPLRVEDFYGPQDKEEMTRWLVRTKWKAKGGVEVTFDSHQTYALTGRLGAYQWSAKELKKILMVWSASEVVTCTIDDTWTTLTEQDGQKRVFKKVK